MNTDQHKTLSIKIVICFFFLFIGSIKAFAQLDSVSVVPSFDHFEVQDGDSTFQQKIISAAISIDDFDFLGTLLITFYDVETNYPIDKQKYTRQELIDLGKWNQGLATVKTNYAQENTSYRIEVIASNYQGLYLETVNSNLIAE